MNRFDRALAILLLLRSGKMLSAPDLARRLGVSTRTIYRDVETLSEVGVPIYAEVGREGGFRLVEGYFLPPIAFTVGEATSLLTGLALLNRLRAKPFATELETATHKLLAVVPDSLRNVLSHVQKVIAFETLPEDVFHPEHTRTDSLQVSVPSDSRDEAQAITVFLKGIFDKRAVALDYISPYGGAQRKEIVAPYGILWDRDRWYLIGYRANGGEKLRFWRADRVIAAAPETYPLDSPKPFNMDELLNRQWLDEAMSEWAQMAPVVIHMTHTQAERLKTDWYYAHAHFEPLSEDRVCMTFGESQQSLVFELLRWLGPGAELIEPHEWRQAFTDTLRMILTTYGKDARGSEPF